MGFRSDNDIMYVCQAMTHFNYYISIAMPVCKCFCVLYRIRPNYRTVHLDFSRLLKNLQ